MKKPALGLLDIHIVVNAKTRLAKCFVAGGELRWTVPVLAEGLSRDTEAWGGDTPEGLWEVTAAEKIPRTDPDADAFGWWFLYLLCHEAIKRAAVGIGWHGGGSDAPDPWAARQDLGHTLGCLRSFNEDLDKKIVPSVLYTLKRGGRVWLSVVR